MTTATRTEIQHFAKQIADYVTFSCDGESEGFEIIHNGYIAFVNYEAENRDVPNENYNKDLSLKSLALEYNVNTSYLGQVFTKEIGIQFSDYLNKIRNSVAKDLILNTNKKISDISKEVGYLDTSYFYRKFKKYYGVTPATLRELQDY